MSPPPQPLRAAELPPPWDGGPCSPGASGAAAAATPGEKPPAGVGSVQRRPALPLPDSRGGLPLPLEEQAAAATHPEAAEAAGKASVSPPAALPAALQRPLAGAAGSASAALPTPGRRFLVFTCAGDQASWRRWLGRLGSGSAAERRWDLVVSYYGSRTAQGQGADVKSGGGGGRGLTGTAGFEGAEHAYRAYGSKWQNMYRLHHTHPGLLASYAYVAV